MHHEITKLLSIASDPIGDLAEGANALDKWGTLGKELAEMLTLKNGFYAYESALLVRPLCNDRAPLGILEWNSPKLWTAEYTENLGNALFFAEDVFGGQYCIRDDTLCTLDPETGQFEVMSTSIRAWAKEMMADYPLRTGYPVAHDWQMTNGVLSAGERLVPKIPFVCGGKYEIGNLHPLVDAKGMLFRASIANQIRDLPDGAEIIIKSPVDRPGGT